MNNICVVAKNKQTYFIKRLTDELKDRVVLFDPWSDFEIPETHHYLVRTTGVYGSELDLMMIKNLPQEKLINSLEVLKLFRTKPSQYLWFEQGDVPTLPWLSLKGTDLMTIEKFFRLYPEVIVKPTIGQGGWGVEVIQWSDFKTWKKKKGKDEDYLLQPFLRGASEFRYFFMKGVAPIVLERKVKSGVTANFSQQGIATLSTLPQDYSQILEECVQRSGAFYGAIDLLVQDGHPYVLELNSVPGIEQLEKVSGRDVIKEFVHGFMS